MRSNASFFVALRAFESARLGNNDGVATTFRSGDEMIALRMQTVTFVPRRTSFAERLGYASAKTEPAPALEVSDHWRPCRSM